MLGKSYFIFRIENIQINDTDHDQLSMEVTVSPSSTVLQTEEDPALRNGQCD